MACPVSIQEFTDASLEEVKYLFESTWKVLNTGKFRGKCVGLMDVKTRKSDKNRYFLVALSGTGVKDPLLDDTPATITNETWTDAMAQLLDDFKTKYPNIILKIAPLSPRGRLYDDVVVRSYLEDIDHDKEKGFLQELRTRFDQRAVVLRSTLGETCTKEKVRQLLERSSCRSSSTSEEDFADVVDWYHRLITQKGPTEALLSFIQSTYTRFSVEDAVDIFLSARYRAQDTGPLPKILCHVIKEYRVGSEQITEDQKSKRIQKLEHDLKDKNIDKLDKDCEIYNFAAVRCGLQKRPSTTKIADLVARCAEDNATAELLQLLESGEIDKVSLENIMWYSTTLRKSGEPVRHLDLCPICCVRFEERLKELIYRSTSRN